MGSKGGQRLPERWAAAALLPHLASLPPSLPPSTQPFLTPPCRSGNFVKWVNANLTAGSTQAMLNYLTLGVLAMTAVMAAAKWSIDRWAGLAGLGWAGQGCGGPGGGCCRGEGASPAGGWHALSCPRAPAACARHAAADFSPVPPGPIASGGPCPDLASALVGSSPVPPADPSAVLQVCGAAVLRH